MSLKAKLEAVIYAAEEPVTLAQLATLFAGEALEWKAAQQAAAAEQTAEEEDPAQSMSQFALIDQGLEYLGLADRPEVYVNEQAAKTATPESAPETEFAAPESAPASAPDPAVPETPAVDGSAKEPTDPEAEAKRQARLRDREVKGVLKHVLDELIADYANDARGVEIREIAGGYRMATKPECHDAVRLFVKSLKPPMKLSLPALETLAVVAYKQPVTAPEVSEIRGVESGGVLGSLLARKLIATAGRKQVIGRPILYKTTKEFLLRFGLKDVAELPSMEEFEKMAAAEIEEMEPEAVAADAADEAAEIEADSPSSEELAEAAEALEGEPGPTGAAEAAQPEESTAAAPEDSADNAVPAPRREPAPPHQPATQQQESEAVSHAEEVKEER